MMEELVALAEMLVIVMLSAFAALLFRLKLCKISLMRDKIFMMIVYMYIIFGVISMERFFLLKTSQIYSYSENVELLVFDIVLGCISVFIIPLLDCANSKNRKDITKTSCITVICVVVMLGVCFLYQYQIYKNINSAIYHVILPECISFVIVTSYIMTTIVIYIINVRDLAILKDVCSDTTLNRLRAKHTCENVLEKQRNLTTWLVSIACTVTACGYPVFETFAANIGEFSFKVKNVVGYYCIYLIVVTVLLAWCINRLIGKGWKIAVLTVFSFLCGSYLQQMLLNNKLFLMDGEQIQVGIGTTIVNLFIWLCVFVGCFVIGHLAKNIWKKIVMFVSGAVVTMQVIGGISLIISVYGNLAESKVETSYFSTDGLYEVASEENVIVFVLDKYDKEYMDEVLAAEPDFLEPLEGFTYFTDTVSQFSRTYPAITYMLTNNTFFELSNDENYPDWAFDNCTFWKQLSEQGYSKYFYEEDSGYIGGDAKKDAVNYVEKGNCIEEEISMRGCIKSMHLISCFRSMPYALKNYYRYTAEEINSLVVDSRVLEKPMYIIDDAQIKLSLNKSGLKIGEDKKAFRFIHMFGAHPPYSLNRNGERVKDSKDLYLEQYMGSMQIVYDYLQKLRELGLYENSTIVITADHGENYENGNVLPDNVNIILFVKPKGVKGGALSYSDAYASQSDMLPTLAAEMNINGTFENGIDLYSDEIKDKNRQRYHYFHVMKNTVQTSTRTYIIKGSSLDFSNWFATEEYHDFRH